MPGNIGLPTSLAVLFSLILTSVCDACVVPVPAVVAITYGWLGVAL